MQSDIASIKQQQTRQSITANLIDSLKKEIENLKEENMKLKLKIENLPISEKPTYRQLFIDNLDQPSTKHGSQDDDVALSNKHTQSQSSNPQPSKNQIQMHTSIELETGEAAEQSDLFTESSRMSNSVPQNTTPTPRRWADICDESTTSSKGWAIAAASVIKKTPFYGNSHSKQESLNLVLSGDIPNGSLPSIKAELITRFNSVLNPAFRGLERDFQSDDISHILLDKKSIRIRLSSLRAKNVILENKKLLAEHSYSEEVISSSSSYNRSAWKMFVSPHLEQQDVKNQNIVLRAFKTLQLKDNGTLSFKVFPQGYSIKIVSQDGLKCYFPFDCKQSPKQFLLSKGIKCRE